MGFKGAKGTSDKEIKDYLHKNIGDFRPNWESLYFDLLGFGELGGLMGAISKKAAVKSLAKGGKVWLKGIEKEFPFAADMAKRTMGKFIRGVRRLPQEVLDPLTDVEFKSMGTVQGRVNIPKAVLQLNPTALPKKAYSILGHEVTHIEDLKPLLGKESKTLKRTILERNPLISRTKGEAEDLAYEVMDKVGDLLSKDKLDYESLKGIIGEYTASKNPQDLGSLVKELGGDVFEPLQKALTQTSALEMKMGRDLVSETMNIEKGFSKKAFQLGREIHTGEVSRETVKSAAKEVSKLEVGGTVVGRGQYLNEALEFADILGGKTQGLEGKVKFFKQMGELPKGFGGF